MYMCVFVEGVGVRQKEGAVMQGLLFLDEVGSVGALFFAFKLHCGI